MCACVCVCVRVRRSVRAWQTTGAQLQIKTVIANCSHDRSLTWCKHNLTRVLLYSAVLALHQANVEAASAGTANSVRTFIALRYLCTVELHM